MPFVRTPGALAWMLVPLLAAGLAAGCGTHTGHAAAQGAAATNAATTPDTIAQTSWTLTRWTSVGGQPRPVQAMASDVQTPGQANPHASRKPSRPDAEARPVTLDFLAQGKDYRVAGFSGCNTYRGRYDLAKGKLSITAPASTRMACPSPAAAALERDYLKALASIRIFSFDSGGAPRQMTLTLDGGDVLEFTRGDDPPTRS